MFLLLLLLSILFLFLSLFHSCCYFCSFPIRVFSSCPVSFLFPVHVIARVSVNVAVPVFISVVAVAVLVAFPLLFGSLVKSSIISIN